MDNDGILDFNEFKVSTKIIINIMRNIDSLNINKYDHLTIDLK